MVTYISDPKEPELHVCYAKECGDDKSTRFGLTVNQTALCADEDDGITCSNF